MYEVINILCATDNAEDQELFLKAIAKLKSTVSFNIVPGVTQIIADCERHNAALPDIIFIDFKIPRRKSLDNLKKLRQCNLLQDTAIIIYSDFSGPAVIQQCLYYGANFYVRKTNNDKLLAELFEDFIKMHKENTLNNTDKSKFLIKL